MDQRHVTVVSKKKAVKTYCEGDVFKVVVTGFDDDIICVESADEEYAFKGYVDFSKIGRDNIERMYLFTSSDFDGEMIECNEGTLEWVDKTRLNDLPLWEGDRVFLPLLDSSEGTFHITLIYDESDNLIEIIGPSYECPKKKTKKKKMKHQFLMKN